MTDTAGRAERAADNQAHVRGLLAARQPDYAAALAVCAAALTQRAPALGAGTDCPGCLHGAWCHPTRDEIERSAGIRADPPWWLAPIAHCIGAGCDCTRLRAGREPAR